MLMDFLLIPPCFPSGLLVHCIWKYQWMCQYAQSALRIPLGFVFWPWVTNIGAVTGELCNLIYVRTNMIPKHTTHTKKKKISSKLLHTLPISVFYWRAWVHKTWITQNSSASSEPDLPLIPLADCFSEFWQHSCVHGPGSVTHGCFNCSEPSQGH